ncbi:MAG: acetyl/propionyl-CoA carboxylase subunit alpha, partial [Rhodospirillales bacterium]|nr:acetyl/propionyl-CoA carboxylase subunit alpha [Rhodospirillales bacterium]
FRINAEDPAKGFLPTPAQITRFEPPSGPGIRLDSGVISGSVIPGEYDSLIAKLIVTGSTRAQALARARRALSEFTIEGPATVLPFHKTVLGHPDFTGENGFAVHTRWIETDFATKLDAAPRPAPAENAGLLRMDIEIDGKRHQIGLPRALLAGLSAAPAPQAAPTRDDGTIAAPVAGTLQGWKIEDKAYVREGDLIAVMETMKMEVQITAPRLGTLRLQAAQGTALNAGDIIATYG